MTLIRVRKNYKAEYSANLVHLSRRDTAVDPAIYGYFNSDLHDGNPSKIIIFTLLVFFWQSLLFDRH